MSRSSSAAGSVPAGPVSAEDPPDLEEAIEALAERLRTGLLERRRLRAVRGQASVDLEVDARDLVDSRAAVLRPDTRERLVQRILRDTVGLGPLEDLLADPEVDEVLVNGGGAVYVERRGRLEAVEGGFADERDLRNTIERILSPLGRRVDEMSPMADARLADGSRVNVIIPPLAVDGPALSIRRFSAEREGAGWLVENGTATAGQMEQLREAVRARRSVLVSGGTGSGKTTMLNVLSGFISADERLVTIEDAAELALRQPHVVRLETRVANVEGKGEVGIRELLKNALRMRPDRIIIGEVRGAEAFDLLSALNTGHEGSLSTVHANSPLDAMRRIEALALTAGVGLPHEVIREQAWRGIDLIAHLARDPADGSRRLERVFATDPAER